MSAMPAAQTGSAKAAAEAAQLAFVIGCPEQHCTANTFVHCLYMLPLL